MRKTLVFGFVAVLAVLMLPGLGIGQSTTSHGGTPTDVFTRTHPAVCGGSIDHKQNLLPTPISVAQDSNVVASFTGTLSRPIHRVPTWPEFLLALQLKSSGTSIAGSPEWIQRGAPGHSTVSVTWTFDSVAAGTYTATAYGRSGGPLDGTPGWNVQSCSLTVLVAPVIA